MKRQTCVIQTQECSCLFLCTCVAILATIRVHVGKERGGGCFSLVRVKVLRLYYLLEIVKLIKAYYISTVGDTLHYTLCAIYFHPHSLHVT